LNQKNEKKEKVDTKNTWEKILNLMSDKAENKPLNKIIRENKGGKKFKVFVKNKQTGNIKTIRFGDSSMKIRKNNPEARKSFMARHGATLEKVKGQKNLSPVYWALRSWKLGTKI
tara:strand:+ start:3633 stop:3977 length:345 start_codon:yes stop_codon:yes gene_type:complete